MCSIIGGTQREKLIELVHLNQHRGNFSYSYTDIVTGESIKGFGDFPVDIIKGDNYKILHVQAPTGGLIEDTNRIHPTKIQDTLHWHNGLLTPRGIKFCQKKLNTNETFDTLLLHKMLYYYGFEILSDIEGLFSCVYKEQDSLYVFRTKHGKLFIDDEMYLSSERFDNSKCINYDTVYMMKDKLIDIRYFKTKRFNYVIPGEF
jgi:hypothetical protein